LENNGRIVEDKLQQGKRGNVIKTDFRNVQHWPTEWDRQAEATRTEENVITVDEMVSLLNHIDQKQTYHSIRQIFKETDLTKCSIIQIIHCIFGLKCILFTNMLAVYYC